MSAAFACCPPTRNYYLLAAAAEPVGDRLLLQRAAETLDIDMAAAFPAVDAGLLDVGWRVEFAPSTGPIRHLPCGRCRGPAAGTSRARRRHGRRGGPGSARLASRPSYARAGRERSPPSSSAPPGRAQSRGGVAAAAAFLTRATELTPDPTRRVQRALDAAFANVQAGTFDAARILITTASDGPLDESQRATHRPATRPARVRIKPRHRSDHSVTRSRSTARATRSSISRAKRTSTHSPQRCSEPGSMAPSACPRSRRPLVPCRAGPSTSPRPPTCCWTDSSR